MTCRALGTTVLQRPVRAPRCLLPPLPGHREEQQAAPLSPLQLHAGEHLTHELNFQQCCTF